MCDGPVEPAAGRIFVGARRTIRRLRTLRALPGRCPERGRDVPKLLVNGERMAERTLRTHEVPRALMRPCQIVDQRSNRAVVRTRSFAHQFDGQAAGLLRAAMTTVNRMVAGDPSQQPCDTARPGIRNAPPQPAQQRVEAGRSLVVVAEQRGHDRQVVVAREHFRGAEREFTLHDGERTFVERPRFPIATVGHLRVALVAKDRSGRVPTSHRSQRERRGGREDGHHRRKPDQGLPGLNRDHEQTHQAERDGDSVQGRRAATHRSRNTSGLDASWKRHVSHEPHVRRDRTGPGTVDGCNTCRLAHRTDRSGALGRTWSRCMLAP